MLFYKARIILKTKTDKDTLNGNLCIQFFMTADLEILKTDNSKMVFSPRIKLFIMKSINKIYHIDKLNMKNNTIFPIG